MSYNESLRSDSNYPVMSQSEWDRAPWNEVDVKSDHCVTVTLSKIINLDVSNPEDDYQGSEYSLTEILDECKELLKLQLNNPQLSEQKKYKKLLSSIDDWEQVDSYIEEC